MRCKKVTPLIKAWLDGELEPGRAVPVEQHVAGCPPCRALAADFGEVSLAVRSFASGPVPPLDVRAVVLRSRQVERESALVITSLRRIAAAAAVVFFLSGAGAWGQWLQHRGDATVDASDALDDLDPVLEFFQTDPTWTDEI
jgi:anti-sigma factor RsiW